MLSDKENYRLSQKTCDLSQTDSFLFEKEGSSAGSVVSRLAAIVSSESVAVLPVSVQVKNSCPRNQIRNLFRELRCFEVFSVKPENFRSKRETEEAVWQPGSINISGTITFSRAARQRNCLIAPARRHALSVSLKIKRATSMLRRTRTVRAFHTGK